MFSTKELFAKITKVFFKFLFPLESSETQRFYDDSHCVKNVQIRSLFWSVFSRIRTEYSVRIWENTEQKKLRIWGIFTQSEGVEVKSRWLAKIVPSSLVNFWKHYICTQFFGQKCQKNFKTFRLCNLKISMFTKK